MRTDIKKLHLKVTNDIDKNGDRLYCPVSREDRAVFLHITSGHEFITFMEAKERWNDVAALYSIRLVFPHERL